MKPASHLGVRQTQTQRLALNTRIMTSLAVLRADAAGLTRFLEEQVAQNPHLRLIPPPAPMAAEWLPRWSQVLGSGGSDALEFAQSASPSLMGHVTERIELMFRPGRNRHIAFAFAEALEPSGWLGRPLAALAAEMRCNEAELEAVLEQLQKIEPAGLFARNLAECLRLQLAGDGQMDPIFSTMLANLDLLARGDLARLARVCGTVEAEILRRFRIIRSLNPKPGSQFIGLAAEPVREPDLLVSRVGGMLQVALNRSVLPSLQIVKAAEKSAGDMAKARALGRMLTARNATLLLVAREVLERQQVAFERGTSALVPLTMAEIALAVGLAESTISRVVAGASIDTPLGTWWLRQLFVGRVAGGAVDGALQSTAALRDAISRLISLEPAGAPLTDEAIAEALATQNMAVARRTVAKYRGLLGLAPAYLRKRRNLQRHKG